MSQQFDCPRYLQLKKPELGKWKALSEWPGKTSKGEARQDFPNHRPCTELSPGREDEDHGSEWEPTLHTSQRMKPVYTWTLQLTSQPSQFSSLRVSCAQHWHVPPGLHWTQWVSFQAGHSLKKQSYINVHCCHNHKLEWPCLPSALRAVISGLSLIPFSITCAQNTVEAQ